MSELQAAIERIELDEVIFMHRKRSPDGLFIKALDAIEDAAKKWDNYMRNQFPEVFENESSEPDASPGNDKDDVSTHASRTIDEGWEDDGEFAKALRGEPSDLDAPSGSPSDASDPGDGWITDRQPAAKDANGQKCVWSGKGKQSVYTHWTNIKDGQPWMPAEQPQPYRRRITPEPKQPEPTTERREWWIEERWFRCDSAYKNEGDASAVSASDTPRIHVREVLPTDPTQAEVAELKMSRAKYESESVQLSHRVKSLQAEVDALRRERDKMTETQAALQQEIIDKDKQIAELKQEVAIVTRQRESYMRNENMAIAERDALAARVKAAEGVADELRHEAGQFRQKGFNETGKLLESLAAKLRGEGE